MSKSKTNPKVIGQYSALYFKWAKGFRFALHVTTFEGQDPIVWTAPKVYKTYSPKYAKSGSVRLVKKGGIYFAKMANFDVQVTSDFSQMLISNTDGKMDRDALKMIKKEIEIDRSLERTLG